MVKHRRWLEAGNLGFRKKRNCTICVLKTKALISFAVTVNVLSKNIKNIIFFFQMKFCIFAAQKNTHNKFCVSHGHIFIMVNLFVPQVFV